MFLQIKNRIRLFIENEIIYFYTFTEINNREGQGYDSYMSLPDNDDDIISEGLTKVLRKALAAKQNTEKIYGDESCIKFKRKDSQIHLEILIYTKTGEFDCTQFVIKSKDDKEEFELVSEKLSCFFDKTINKRK